MMALATSTIIHRYQLSSWSLFVTIVITFHHTPTSYFYYRSDSSTHYKFLTLADEAGGGKRKEHGNGRTTDRSEGIQTGLRLSSQKFEPLHHSDQENLSRTHRNSAYVHPPTPSALFFPSMGPREYFSRRSNVKEVLATAETI